MGEGSTQPESPARHLGGTLHTLLTVSASTLPAAASPTAGGEGADIRQYR